MLSKKSQETTIMAYAMGYQLSQACTALLMEPTKSIKMISGGNNGFESDAIPTRYFKQNIGTTVITGKIMKSTCKKENDENDRKSEIRNYWLWCRRRYVRRVLRQRDAWTIISSWQRSATTILLKKRKSLKTSLDCLSSTITWTFWNPVL